MQLREYQQHDVAAIHASWQAGNRNVMYVCPTGGGKTVTLSHIVHNYNQPSCAIAHRKELVGQMALALARCGVHHRVIGPTSLIKFVIYIQQRELGCSFYNANAPCAVAGIDTLIRRTDQLSQWMQQVRLWVTDEAHHIVHKPQPNKWGKGVDLFPNAFGLGVTATPTRADGKGLGRHANGVFDDMVEGPSMRDLIDAGWLSPYRIFAPPSDIDLTDVPADSSGDFNQKKLKTAVRQSHIVGDVVEHYLRITPGKLGVTFASDVDTATDMAHQYNQNGVPAAVVTGKTPDRIRTEVIERFGRRELLQLVNVDLFGEGFDIPAIEVVSFARPTQSYSLFCQQFGRALRIMDGKEHAVIIDHVGNVVRHGLPDAARIWSLDAREKRPKSKDPDDDIPLRYCTECTSPYQRILIKCPYCGHHPVPAARSAPEFVDGDLFELDETTLAAMRGAIHDVDNPAGKLHAMARAGAPDVAVHSFRKNANRRIEAQKALRESMAWWAGYQRDQGRSDQESYRVFYHSFGTDVLSAQALGRPEAFELATKINNYLARVYPT